MPQQLPRPDARTIRRTQALESSEAGQVLWAAGDLLRGADAEAHVEARAALARITPASALAALGAIDVGRSVESLSRAIEGAFDAGLEGDEDARAVLELSAIEGLEQRDVVDCVLCAVSTFDGLADLDATEAASLREAASVISGAMIAADAEARPRVRALTAVNERRRERADVLDDAARGRAWWWSELAGEEHDGLVELLAGKDVDAGSEAVRAAGLCEIPAELDALGAALRILDRGGAIDVAPRNADDAMRWAESAAKRRQADAIALELTRTLDVERIDSSSLDEDAVA